jgi:formamidopyrimidine-DNA glycosylase
MPELPEVERVRLSLLPHLVNARIARAVLHRADICESFEATPEGVARKTTRTEDLLAGDTVRELRRLGKQLAIIGRSGRVVCVHLGMSGQLLWKKPGDEVRGGHVHAEWRLDNRQGRELGRLLFRDPRRFGGIWTFSSVQSLEQARWSQLGPDALHVSAEQLRRGLEGSRRAVKAALLDQGIVAGVGNIYADEALFLSGIRPTRLASRLKPPESTRLAGAIREVLQRSIETGGSTLRDYVDADGKRGTAQDTHAVYGRGGQACIRCGRKLRQAKVAQRTTVWCAHCQK